MSDSVALSVRRSAGFALTGFVGIWLSGCADASRFADNGSPFSNPFAVASNDVAAPTPRVSSRPLPASPYATAARPSPTAVASAQTPGPATTGSLHPRAEAVGGSAAGWTAEGGSPVIVGSADDAGTLSSRYGVPQAALLSANGLHSPGEVRSGMRIVVPVYNVRGDAHVAKADEDAKPRRTAKADDEDAKPRHARKDDDEEARPRHKARSDDENSDKHRAKAKVKAEDDSQDDAPRSRKVHKAEADDRDASKAAKAEAAAERPAKAAKAVAEAAKPLKDKQKFEKPAPQVAKAESPKAAKKPEVDKTPTADIAPTASAQSAQASEAGQLRWPARGRIIQGFKQAGNDGINIALPEGTSVRAAEDGKVAYAGSALKGYGNLVLIRHPNGIVTAYANNGELDVKGGETVKRGQVIAKSGQTGDVSTPQLHFEVRKGQTPVDPTGYLAGL
jgi:murein DD-endopeptidase MepM/ murein hydrolase activator NlpD